MTGQRWVLWVCLCLCCAGATGAAEPGPGIDRHALVSRHNVVLSRYDPANPFQVGNGHFAFGVDVTGLQTFSENLGTFSDWGWHTFPNPEGFREEETLREIVDGAGRKVKYACGPDPAAPGTPEQKARIQAACDWYRRAPHRLHLGRVGFELLRVDGKTAKPKDLQNIRQTLDLWSGTIKSTFTLDGVPVEVLTSCHPEMDAVAVRVRSALLAAGRLNVFWDFPYVEFNRCAPTWAPATNASHRTIAVAHGDRRVDLERILDGDHYHAAVAWSGGRWAASSPHRFGLKPEREAKELSFAFGFANRPIGELPDFKQTAAACAKHWENFWKSGGAIDLSASRDPRWKELERRIVIAQYLTAVNSAGSSPPQESGLFSNSWYGKFHLEMTLWHGAHFVLWGREPLVAGWMDWFRGPGLEGARRQAARQGFKGARWNKMIGPDAAWESPSGAGAFRMTQQGHAIYWAELMYREAPTRKTLEQYRELVQESAEFMADYLGWDGKSGRYVLGPPLLSGSEGTKAATTYNATVELSYWIYGLRTAQLWRERLGLARVAKWDEILAKISKPPVADGLCVDVESLTPFKHGRPAWLEAYGCMRGDAIDLEAMGHTFDRIWSEIKAGQPWRIWGCDFPMLAMTAARLNRPADAVDALLLEHKGNQYLANGFNNGGSRPYLPASGGLLWAAAMMAAGWEGGPTRPAPGFPDDGSWTVKWEGLRKAP